MPGRIQCKNGVIVTKNTARHNLELVFGGKKVNFHYEEPDRDGVYITVPILSPIEPHFLTALVEAAPQMFDHVHYEHLATTAPIATPTAVPTPTFALSPTHNETDTYDTHVLLGMVTKHFYGCDS